MKTSSSFRVAGSQVGMSLVELMIALLLGTILTLGVVQFFLGSNKTYRTTEALAQLQESVRYSLSKLNYEIRMAGHYGCLVGEPADHLDSSHAAYDATLYDTKVAVIGWEADDTEPGEKFEIETLDAGGNGWGNGSGDDLPDALAGDVVPGNDVLVVNSGARVGVVLDGNPSPPANTIGTQGSSNIAQGTVLVVVAGDCAAGDRFQKTNSANASTITRGGGGSPGNIVSQNLHPYDDSATVYRYTSTAYYIGEGVDGEPALFQQSLEPGGAGAPLELISGVENMQVLYGLQNTAGEKGPATSYVSAADVDDWEEVVSVRLAFLMRSVDRILDQVEERTFNLSGTEIAPGADQRARLVASSTIGIRNRLE